MADESESITGSFRYRWSLDDTLSTLDLPGRRNSHHGAEEDMLLAASIAHRFKMIEADPAATPRPRPTRRRFADRDPVDPEPQREGSPLRGAIILGILTVLVLFVLLALL